MSFDIYGFLGGVIIFIPGAAIVAWVAIIEIDNVLQKMDMKIAGEILRRRRIDASYGDTGLTPDISEIRNSCKK